MKNTLIIATFLLLTSSTAFAQQKFIIKGLLSKFKGEATIMLSYRDNGILKENSAITKNGAFTFSGNVAEPTRATLTIKIVGTDTASMSNEQLAEEDKKQFFLENTVITVKGNSYLKTSSISGGNTQTEFLSLQEALKSNYDKIDLVYERFRQLENQNDQKSEDSLRAQNIALRHEETKIENDFIRKHPNSYVSADLLLERSSIIDLESFEPMFNVLSADLKNSIIGKKMQKRVDLAKKTSVGKPAMEFTEPTIEDRPFSLSSLKGKYVLLDFWASWCGPCRAEHPTILKAYKLYKDKNFEVVSVSLDDNKQDWVDAVKKDNLPWLHVSDLKGWKNEVVLMYGITAVPKNFLLDPNGMIIGTDLLGEDLSKKLEEIIK